MQNETRIRPSELVEVRPGPTGTPVERRHAYLYGALALAGIWVAVVFTSIFAPDLVTGTTQDHFPIAVVVALLAGLAATRSVVRALTQRIGGAGRWAWYDLAVGGIWLAVALASIFLPVTVSGTDPTRFPVAVLVAPIAGAILTGAITELFVATRR
jgi:hypothetical protein